MMGPLGLFAGKNLNDLPMNRQQMPQGLLGSAVEAVRKNPSILLDVTPVVGGIKGAKEEWQAGNPGWSLFNAATVPLDLMTMGTGGLAAKAALAGMVTRGGMQSAKDAIELALKGGKPSRAKIAELTQEQFDGINALRAKEGKPPLPSRVVEFTGRHHSGSRSKDGYATQDMLKQLMSGLDDSAIPAKDTFGRAGLQATIPRHDGYGNLVNDLVAFNVDGNHTLAEVLSAIPKGDKGNRPIDQIRKAGKQPPEFLSHPISDGSRRIGANQPLPSVITEQTVRNWIAQDNAVKMLGLPANNTGMDRARAMDGIDAYHGTSSDIQQIDPSRFGESTGAESAKRAWWAVSEPQTANGYANYAANQVPIKRQMELADKFEKRGDWDSYDAALSEAERLEAQFYDNPMNGQNIMPLVLLPNNPKTMDAMGAEFTDVEGGVNNFLKQAKLGKHDVAVLQNLSDDVGFNGRPANHFGVLDPSIVRSRFAAFDPARRHMSDLMGFADPRLLGLIAGGGLLGLGAYGE